MPEDDYPTLESVDLRRMAFIVTVDNDGDVQLIGQADAEYIVSSLRSIADSFEKDGWSDGQAP